MSALAIVIPAYKKTFLDGALKSIVNQTNKDFNLYIGDDCSPEDLYQIVKKYESGINILYHHFENNLGATDLVGQWERCINLTKGEEWIWLFSDDDLMDPGCVENFYYTLSEHPGYDLFHFNVKKIDEKDRLTLSQFRPFPEITTSQSFLREKLQPGYYSTVVEYIFRKSHFDEMGRFQKFDLAWGSDDATWLKLAGRNGIRTIGNSLVYWRESQINISSINGNNDIVKRKLRAQIAFAGWTMDRTDSKEIEIFQPELTILLREWFLRAIKYSIRSLGYRQINAFLIQFHKSLRLTDPGPVLITRLYAFKMYRHLVDFVKKTLSVFKNSIRK